MMKRSDQGIETPINTKEPRLEVEESATTATCLSSAAQKAEEGLDGHNNSSVDKSASSLDKEILTMKPRAQARTKITAGGIEGIFAEENYGSR